MQRIRLLLAGIIGTIFAVCGLIVIAAPASASLFNGAKDQACNGANLTDSGGCSATPDTTLSDKISTVISILSFVVGVIAVVMIIVGGIRFITSQGDGSATAAARNTIIYAVVGIVVAVMAQIIVKFVVGRANLVKAPASQAQPAAPAPAPTNNCSVKVNGLC